MKNIGDLNSELDSFKKEVLKELQTFKESFSPDSGEASGTKEKDVFTSFQSRILKKFAKIEEDLRSYDDRLDDLENYSRRNCLVIHGITEERGEDIDAVVQDFISKDLRLANIDVMTHVDRCHRLGPPKKITKDDVSKDEVPKGRRPIIVKFCSYRTRSKLWLNKKLLKGTKKLITESLTIKRIELLNEAKKIFSQTNVWTSDGRICVKFPDDSRANFTTRSGLDEAIRKLTTKFPPSRKATRNQPQ